MTNEEAIKNLNTMFLAASEPEQYISIGSFEEVKETIKKAIKALAQQPCEDWYDVPSNEMTLEQARQAVKDLRKKLPEYLDQQPCEDAVSTQATLNCVTFNEVRYRMVEDINALPSVTPKEKTGHWYIRETYPLECESWECSECKEVVYEKTKYCPNCGARMVSE